MGLYERFLLPRVIEATCGNRVIARQRQKIVPAAEGRVLEVGVGSGLNFSYYDARKVTRIFALDPSGPMIERARDRAGKTGIDVEFLPLKGEEIPLDDGAVDTVLVTYTLCTIVDLASAFAQMRRVLSPGGRLLFCEHGAAPDASVRKWQNRLNPVWRRMGGGCNLNRVIPDLINSHGFQVEDMETMYLPKTWRFAGYNYWGSARTS
jgi:ubiquinone/menaquinone biosynthesis C-methylase UbiE